MKGFGPGAQSLGELRSFCLYEQRPAEARLMAAAAEQLRSARQASGLSRPDLAARLGVSVDVVVAIENGYGRPGAALPLVERARRLGGL